MNGGYRQIAPQLVYTNHDYDAVLGLYYAKARFYDPEDKHFLSMDPVKGEIINPLSLTPYVYCVDNPLRWTDPTGEVLTRPSNTNLELTDGGNSYALAVTKASVFPVGTIMEVGYDRVNLHLKADANSPVVCQLSKGYLVTILGQTKSNNGYLWENVNFKGNVGWVVDEHLKLGYDVVLSGPTVIGDGQQIIPEIPNEDKANNDIKEAQTILTELHLYYGPIDGQSNSEFEKALTDFVNIIAIQ